MSIEQEDDSKLFDKAIQDTFIHLQSDVNNKTKRYVYFSDLIPGESSYKYFNYFRKWQCDKDYKQNLNHFIYSDNIETLLYSLKFQKEKFFIIYPHFDKNNIQYSIINVSNVRSYFLAQVSSARTISKNRIIDDIIGLMIIVHNQFIPILKLNRSTVLEYSDIFDAYFRLNQRVKNEYQFLIKNDVFDVYTLKHLVETLKKIIKEKEKSKYDQQRAKVTKKFGTLPSIRVGGATSALNDIDHKPFIPQDPPSVNSLPPVPPPAKKSSQQQPNKGSNPPPVNKPVQSQPMPANNLVQYPSAPVYGTMQYLQNIASNPAPLPSANYIDPPPYGYFSPPNHPFPPKNYPKVEKRTKDNKVQISSAFMEQSQELLRSFNYAFLYFTKSIPSWNYYYPFKTLPYLGSAVYNMEHEDKSFFNDLDNEFPEKLLQMLIILPVYYLTGPWNIYKIKIPEFSAIAKKYWYPVNSEKDVTIFDLQEVKQFYKEALLTMKQEEIEMHNESSFDIFIIEK